MKTTFVLAVLLGSYTFAHAAPLYTDDFSTGLSTVTLPGEADYTPHPVPIAPGLFDTRDIREANYAGNGMDTFVTSVNGMDLTVTGNGTASGLSAIGYTSSAGAIDLSGAGSVTLFVQSNTSAVSGSLGSYNDHYNNLSTTGFTIPAGFSGEETLYFSNFHNSTLSYFDAAHANSLYLDLTSSSGSSLVISNFTVNAVPEPATLAAFGLGACALLRRRKRD